MFLWQWGEVTLSERGAREKLGQSHKDRGAERTDSCLAFRRLRRGGEGLSRDQGQPEA